MEDPKKRSSGGSRSTGGRVIVVFILALNEILSSKKINIFKKRLYRGGNQLCKKYGNKTEKVSKGGFEQGSGLARSIERKVL